MALGRLDLLARGMVDRGVEGDVDDLLADVDQPAPHREVVDHAAVVGRVDDGGGLGREAGEVLRHGDAAEVVVAQERLQRDGGGDLAGPHERRCHLEDPAVDLLGEVLGLEEVRHAVEGVVVDQDGAEQRLLGFHVVRGLAEGFGRLRQGRHGGPSPDRLDIAHGRHPFGTRPATLRAAPGDSAV